MNADPKNESGTPELVRSLMDMALPKDAYEADLAVTDRYQQFSAEMLRLSLAGIGVFGFVFKDVVLSKEGGEHYALAFSHASWCFASGLVVLAISAGFSLAHRYYASDCIGIQISYLRAMRARDERMKATGDRDVNALRHNAKMKDEKTQLRKVLKRCAWILGLAAAFLCIGVTFIATGLALTLFLK